MAFLSVIDKLNEWSGRIFSFLAVVATFLVTAEVVMRYVLKAPTIWSLELTIYLFGAMYMVGGAYAQLLGAHVKVDALYGRWTSRVRAIADLLTAPFFFLALGLLAWVGLQFTLKSIVGAETSHSIWSPPIWPARLFIPLGSFLLLLQGLAKFIRDFRVARTGSGEA